MEVGTILYANLGWSAGIPTWWRVIKSTTKTVWIQQIKSRIIAHDGYGQNGVKVPVDELDERHKPFMRRIGKDNSVRIDDYSYAYEWDGEPKCYNMRDKVSDLDTSEMPKRLNKYGKYETNLFSIHPDDWKNFADYVCRCLSRVVCNRFVYCFVFNGTQYKNAKLVVALKHKDSNEKYIPTLGYGHVYTATNEPASSVIEATINKYIRPLTDSERERLNAK